MEPYFDHEKLRVYQESLKFVEWNEQILKKLPKKLSVWSQSDAASTSIVLNIAEGNGKFTPRDRCKFFDISKASVLECAAALDIIVAKKHFTVEEVHFGKQTLKNIFSMLIGLIRHTSPDRVCESPQRYSTLDNENESVFIFIFFDSIFRLGAGKK